MLGTVRCVLVIANARGQRREWSCRLDADATTVAGLVTAAAEACQEGRLLSAEIDWSFFVPEPVGGA